MNIAIDTSILRRDRKLEGSDVLLLGKMGKLGLLKLHIPWIIYREITTHSYLESKTIIDKMVKDLNSFNKQGISESDHLKLKEIAKQIEVIDIEASILERWDDFIESSKTILHGIDENHGELVMTSYFLGTDPFSKPKSRKDIPDAFIYQALRTISDEFGKIYFVCDDTNLRNCCDKIPNIVGLSGFSDLFDSSDFKAINDKYKLIEHYAEELIAIEEAIEEIKTIAKKDIQNNKIFNDITISNSDIPDDNNEGIVVGIDKISNIDIDKTKIQYIDNYFYIPIKADGVFTIEYFIYKADYYLIEDSRYIHITDSDWNDHYFLVEETFDVKFSFKYKIAKDKVAFLEPEIEDISFDQVNVITTPSTRFT